MKLETNTIYSFKLNTGEELVAKIVEINQDHDARLVQCKSGQIHPTK